MNKIYTSPTCCLCQAVKSYLKSKKVKFQEIDISQQPDKIKNIKDISDKLPILFIKGEVIIGFDKEKIDNLL